MCLFAANARRNRKNKNGAAFATAKGVTFLFFRLTHLL